MATRDVVRDVLATHTIGVNDMRCIDCRRGYAAIADGLIECEYRGKKTKTARTGAVVGRNYPDRRTAAAGYRDPRRPSWAWLRLVCEPELRDRLVEEARRQDVNLSEIVRRACRAYVEGQK